MRSRTLGRNPIMPFVRYLFNISETSDSWKGVYYQVHCSNPASSYGDGVVHRPHHIRTVIKSSAALAPPADYSTFPPSCLLTLTRLLGLSFLDILLLQCKHFGWWPVSWSWRHYKFLRHKLCPDLRIFPAVWQRSLDAQVRCEDFFFLNQELHSEAHVTKQVFSLW